MNGFYPDLDEIRGSGHMDYIHTDQLGTPQKMSDVNGNFACDGGDSEPFILAQLPTSPVGNSPVNAVDTFCLSATMPCKDVAQSVPPK